ncbi:MAG: hypothetical protein R3302_09500 [Sulfurimonadaceae bacterium]|nr:hypothetical protein [Sulfurimonadaceae bacterium]
MRRLLVLMIVTCSFIKADNDLSYDYELDAYYSNVSAFFQVGDEPVIDASGYSEEQLYADLVLSSWRPNTFLVEAAVHPMALGGIAYRNAFPESYEDLRIDELDLNIINAVTAGYEEPYALSFFVGRMVTFEQGKKDGHIGHNRAYAGYLLTLGDYSIKDNRAIYNQWAVFEAKVKGTRDFDEEKLDWSFRVGAKINKNPDFADSIYIGARRSRIDFFREYWSWFYNGGFDISVAVTADTFELMQVEMLFEKKWPIFTSDRISLGIEFGYIYDSDKKYRGALYEEGVVNHRLILRPNLSF